MREKVNFRKFKRFENTFFQENNLLIFIFFNSSFSQNMKYVFQKQRKIEVEDRFYKELILLTRNQLNNNNIPQLILGEGFNLCENAQPTEQP